MKAYYRLIKRQIKTKFRRVKRQQVVVGLCLSFVFLGFQNCIGPKQKMSTEAENTSTPSSSSGGSSSSGSGSSVTKSPFLLTGPSYSNRSGSGTSSGGSGFAPVGSSSGSSSGSNGSRAFQFKKDLSELIIYLKLDNTYNSGSGTLDVTVINGAGAYTYQWYKDGRLIDPNSQNSNYIISGGSLYLSAQDYSLDGSYHVVVYDTKTKIQSRTVRVRVEENKTGCAKDTYWASKSDPLAAQLKIQNRFNNPRGKFLIGNAHMYSYWNYGLSNYKSFSIGAGSYQQTTNITCTTYVQNLHEDTHTNDSPNCARDPETYACVQSPDKQWEGNLTIQCANNKWIMLSNTCRWMPPEEMCNKGHNEYCPPEVRCQRGESQYCNSGI